MLIFSILINFLYLINCSDGWFFEHIFFDDISTRWFNYKKSFKKLYSDSSENSARRTIFKENFNFINQINRDYAKGLISFRTELNQFADLTTGEFLKQKTGLIVNFNQSSSKRPPKIRNKRETTVPNFKDWRLNGKVSPIQDQGKCGSCYAFATVSAVESFKAINSNYMPLYNVQELIDCTVVFGNKKTNCNGCNGGSLSCGFDYLQSKGLSDLKNQLSKNAYTLSSKKSDATFKNFYTSGTRGIEGTCKRTVRKPLIYNYATYYNDSDAVDIQTWLYMFSPIAVGINAELRSFQFYKEGIYDDFRCSNNLNHAVLLVGFGTDRRTRQDYWILKNSWGEEWGENGFMRIARGKNICGIEMYGAFPVN